MITSGLKCVHASPMTISPRRIKIFPRHSSIPKITSTSENEVEFTAVPYSGPTLEAIREGELFTCGIMPWTNAPIAHYGSGFIHPLLVVDPDGLEDPFAKRDFLREEDDGRIVWVYSNVDQKFFLEGGHFMHGKDAVLVTLAHRMWDVAKSASSRLMSEHKVKDVVTTYEIWVRTTASSGCRNSDPSLLKYGPEFYKACAVLETFRATPNLLWNSATTVGSAVRSIESFNPTAISRACASQMEYWKNVFGDRVVTMVQDVANVKQFVFFESLESIHRSLEESKFDETNAFSTESAGRTLVIVKDARVITPNVTYSTSGSFLTVLLGGHVHVVCRRDLERSIKELGVFLKIFTRSRISHEQLTSDQSEVMGRLMGSMSHMDRLDVSIEGRGDQQQQHQQPWTAEEIFDIYYIARLRVSRDPVALRILSSRLAEGSCLRDEIKAALDECEQTDQDEDPEFFNPKLGVALEYVSNRDLVRAVRAQLEDLRVDALLCTALFYDWDRVVCEDQTYESRVLFSKQFWTTKMYNSLWTISPEARRRVVLTSALAPSPIKTLIRKSKVEVDRSACFVANHLVHCWNTGMNASSVYKYLQNAIPYSDLSPAWWSRNSMTEKCVFVQPKMYDSFEDAIQDVKYMFETCVDAVRRSVESMESLLHRLTTFERLVSAERGQRVQHLQQRSREPFAGDEFPEFGGGASAFGETLGEGIFGPGFPPGERVHIVVGNTGGILVSVGDFGDASSSTGQQAVAETVAQKTARKLSGIRSSEAVLEYYPQEMVRNTALMDKATVVIGETTKALDLFASKTAARLAEIREGGDDEDDREILCDACFTERACVLTAWGDTFCEVCGSSPKCPKTRNALGSLNVVMFDKVLRSDVSSAAAPPTRAEGRSFKAAFVEEIRSIRESLGGLGLMFVTESPDVIQDLLCDDFRDDIWMKAYYSPQEKRPPIAVKATAKNTCWTLSLKELTKELQSIGGSGSAQYVRDQHKTIRGLLSPAPQVGALVVCDMDASDDSALSILAEVRHLCTTESSPIFCINVPGATLLEYMWDFFVKPQARQRKSMIEQASTTSPTNSNLFDQEDDDFVRKTMLCPLLFRGVLSMQEWSTMNDSIDSRVHPPESAVVEQSENSRGVESHQEEPSTQGPEVPQPEDDDDDDDDDDDYEDEDEEE